MGTKKKTQKHTLPVIILLAVLLIIALFFVLRAVTSVGSTGKSAASRGAYAPSQAASHPTSAITAAPTPSPTVAPTQTPRPIIAREQKPEGANAPYCILVSRKAQLAAAYTLDENGCYSVLVRAMPATVPDESALEDGVYYTNDAHVWFTLYPQNLYARYSTRIMGPAHFHSVPYLKQESDAMRIEDYQALRTASADKGVTLLLSDAKWIYDHCPEGTPVYVTGEDGFDHLLPLASVPPLAEKNRGWDPTDDNERNPFFVESRETAPAATPYPGATAVENPFAF